MNINTTLKEHKFLIEAEDDNVKFGKTEKRCPRCGNKIIFEDNGSAYTIRCKSKNCIKAEFRGI